MFLDWSPIDQPTLDQIGTDLATAVAGRLPLDQRECALVLRRIDVTTGWREIYDGLVPEIGFEPGEPRPRCLRFAAPEGDGWKSLTFEQRSEDGWSVLCTPGPMAVWEDD